MSLSKFFIDRPIFAGVISIAIIFLAGLICDVRNCPSREYPGSCATIGYRKSAIPRRESEGTIAETVATPLEEQINGVENMLYMVFVRPQATER